MSYIVLAIATTGILVCALIVGDLWFATRPATHPLVGHICNGQAGFLAAWHQYNYRNFIRFSGTDMKHSNQQHTHSSVSGKEHHLRV